MSSPLDVLLLPFVAAATVVLSIIVAKLLRRERTSKEGPRAPVAGNVLHQLRHFKRYHDFLAEVSARHKTFRLVGPGRSDIFTVDPANVEYILKSNFPNFGKGWFRELSEELLGDGIFVADGEKWRHQRKLASFEFSTRVLREWSSMVFKENAAKLAGLLSRAADAREAVDIQELFMKATMDSISRIAFGAKLNCLDGENEEGARFVKAFDDSSALIMWRLTNPLWKIARYLKIGSESTVKANITVIDDFVYGLISRKLNQKSNAQEQDDNVERADILSRFLQQSEKDPENMTMKYLRDIILNFVIAGKDTTAGTLSWFIYMLCKHPSSQEKAAFEVKEATRSEHVDSFDDFASRITEDSVNKMHYLHAALTETLRLYPAVPLDAKVCFSDDKLPDGFVVNKGDVVGYLPYSMGRMEFLWGEDAEMFHPERWLDENGVVVPESPFKFTAFQAGPRICLGKEFAYRQMKVFAAVLLRFFVFRLVDERKEAGYRIMMTLHIDGGLPVWISRR